VASRSVARSGNRSGFQRRCRHYPRRTLAVNRSRSRDPQCHVRCAREAPRKPMIARPSC